jgi:hypothetical protein
MMKKRLALLALLVCAAWQSAAALTLSDLKVDIRRLVNDKADPKIKFTDAEIVSLVNESQREAVNNTWCLTTRTTQALSLQTTYYDLPDDFIAVRHVEYREVSGRTRELTEISERAKQQSSPDYERITGQPVEYFVRNATATANTSSQIAVLPVVSSSTSLGTVTIDYYKMATDLSASTDVPFDGVLDLYSYHYFIVYDVSSKLKAIKGDPSAVADMQLAQAYLALMKANLGRMPNYAPGFSGASK